VVALADFTRVRTNVAYHAGETLKVDLTLHDDTSILGTILALDNSPLTTVVVQAIRQDANLVLPAVLARPDLQGAPVQPGLMGEYFQSASSVTDFLPAGPFRGPTLRRVDHSINFGDPRHNGVRAFGGTEFRENFYVRWTGSLRIPKDAKYTFFVESDDGSRLSIDGKLIVDNGGLHSMEEKSGEAELKAGDHELKLELFENDGEAGIKFSWEPTGVAKEIVPEGALFHKKDKDLDK